MKKNYTIIVALVLSSLTSFAQPVLNASDIPTNVYGSANEYQYTGTIAGITPGGAGPNQVWDFSALTTLTLQGTLSTVPVATVPWASSFPSANFALKYTPNSNCSGCIIEYSLYKSTATFYEEISSTNGSGGYTDLSLNPSIIYTFPYTYNTVINYIQSSPVIIPSNTTTYDAYGTFISPFGTYTNVIRQKKVYANSTSYLWYNTNPLEFIMTAYFSSSGSSDFSFYENTNNNEQRNQHSKKQHTPKYTNRVEEKHVESNTHEKNQCHGSK